MNKKRNLESPGDIQDLRFQAQHWKLTRKEAVTCPELGPELETFEKGEEWSHFRADTECLDSVEPVMTVYSTEHTEGEYSDKTENMLEHRDLCVFGYVLSFDYSQPK